jgi:hypothetical protein
MLLGKLLKGVEGFVVEGVAHGVWPFLVLKVEPL